MMRAIECVEGRRIYNNCVILHILDIIVSIIYIGLCVQSARAIEVHAVWQVYSQYNACDCSGRHEIYITTLEKKDLKMQQNFN